MELLALDWCTTICIEVEGFLICNLGRGGFSFEAMHLVGALWRRISLKLMVLFLLGGWITVLSLNGAREIKFDELCRFLSRDRLFLIDCLHARFKELFIKWNRFKRTFILDFLEKFVFRRYDLFVMLATLTWNQDWVQRHCELVNALLAGP